jgi:epoxyqueuosine reductase
MNIEAKIKSLALSVGFDMAGIASLAQEPEHLKNYADWLDADYAGEMQYLQRQKDKRLDPTKILAGAKSMICVGLIYNTNQPYSIQSPDPWISRYAWGDDYHELMWTKLSKLEALMKESFSESFEVKSYSDTGPISEKAWAAAAGLGWVGKHTNLINREKGSWFFLGEILSTLELIPDQPAPDLCGSCRKCLDACPTDAFPEAYTLDARRCISYLTIEKRGEIPQEFHEAIGLNLYGCDICQDVCPWNHWKISGNEAAFLPRAANLAPDLEKLVNISDEDFAGLYNNSAIKRTKVEGMRRNARIAKSNLVRRHGNKEG